LGFEYDFDPFEIPPLPTERQHTGLPDALFGLKECVKTTESLLKDYELKPHREEREFFESPEDFSGFRERYNF